MHQEYLSIKIKDGLFIANKRTASDFEFLVANRFKYVLNCTSEVKNYFETSNFIHYYKLKYSKHKSQQLLWKDNMKKLTKIIEFINTAEQEAECCLIHSNEGNNRCIAVVISYLMAKYKWKLSKTLQFLLSKNVQIKLTENFYKQLVSLEQTLESQNLMSTDWTKQNISDEQLILTNTYLNSIEIPFEDVKLQSNLSKKVKWKDKIQKMQYNEKQLKVKRLLMKEEPKENVQKRPAKSQIIQIKKQNHKPSSKQMLQNQKNSNRPSSSFSKNYSKKKKQQDYQQKLKISQKQQKDISGDSSTDDNNILVNNFISSENELKRFSKIIPRKSEDNIKLIRAFSEKDYSSFKQPSNKNVNVNSSKQSLKASTKSRQTRIEQKVGQKTEVAKHLKSTHNGRMRQTSPKTNIRSKI